MQIAQQRYDKLQDEIFKKEGAFDESLKRPAFISKEPDFAVFSSRGSFDNVYKNIDALSQSHNF